MFDIEKWELEVAEWSDEKFGRNRSPEGPIHHLKKEVEELIADPYHPEEYADCMLLLLDAWRLRGGNLETLLIAARSKFEINKARQWGEPDENGVVEHIR